MTRLAQIVAILNSRPLEPLTDDLPDVSEFTPGHFFIGGALTILPEPSLPELASSRLTHWQRVQQRVQVFWSQWSAHYLQKEQVISKWHHVTNQLRFGSLVLLADEWFIPCKYLLARITELHSAKDALARVATLRAATTTLSTPVVKFAPLSIPGYQDHQGAKERIHQQFPLMREECLRIPLSHGSVRLSKRPLPGSTSRRSLARLACGVRARALARKTACHVQQVP